MIGLILSSAYLHTIKYSQTWRLSEHRGRHFVHHAAAAAAKSIQSCPTLSDPMDCSPPLSMGFPRQEYWRDFLFTMVGLKTEDEAEGVFSQKMLLVLEGGRCLEQTRYIYIRHR